MQWIGLFLGLPQSWNMWGSHFLCPTNGLPVSFPDILLLLKKLFANHNQIYIGTFKLPLGTSIWKFQFVQKKGKNFYM